MHDVTRESAAAVTFVRENFTPVYDVVVTQWKFDADAILFWKIKFKKRDI